MSEEALRMTDPKPSSTTESQPTPPQTILESELIRARKFRQLMKLVNQVRTSPSGERFYLRFSQLEIIEHWLLMFNFFVLAFTGLLEMFAYNRLAAGIITLFFNDVDKVRGIHNLAALFFSALVLEHAIRVVVKWFVKNDPPVMMPSRADFNDFLRIWKYNLGRNIPRPEFARFNIDQKFTYWTVAIFSLVMLLTSGIMWFQIELARWMPEAILPMARALHNMTGLLAVVTMLPWHLYHTVLKEWNPSIFTGYLNEQTIRRQHRMEYRQILAALDEYQKLALIHPIGENQPALTGLLSNEKQAQIQEGSDQKSESMDLLIHADKDNGTPA
jgi:formate dehydrogenase gamma subunit